MEVPIAVQQEASMIPSEHPASSPSSELRSPLKWTRPLLRPLGSLLQQTGDGGSSKEYDSWDKNRV